MEGITKLKRLNSSTAEIHKTDRDYFLSEVRQRCQALSLATLPACKEKCIELTEKY